MKILKIYGDKAEGLMYLSNEAVGQLVKAMITYQEEGTVPELTGEAVSVWCFYRQMIDANIKSCEQHASAGRNGGIASGVSRGSTRTAARIEAKRSEGEATRSKSKAKRSRKEERKETKKTEKEEKEETLSSLCLPTQDAADTMTGLGDERKEQANPSPDKATGTTTDSVLNASGLSPLMLEQIRRSGIVRTVHDALECIKAIRAYGEDMVMQAFHKAEMNHARTFAYIDRCCREGLTPEPCFSGTGSPRKGSSQNSVPVPRYHQRPVSGEINTADAVVEAWRREHPESRGQLR